MKLLQKKGSSLAAALLILGISAPTSKGALTLNIDPTTETFYFSGSDVINLRGPSEFNPTILPPYIWQVRLGYFPGSTSQNLGFVGTQASDLLSVALSDTTGVDFQLSTNGFWNIILRTSNTNELTTLVSGGGWTNNASYSSLLSNNIALIEASDGLVLTSLFNGGETMMTVNVTASAVPEPSSTALLGLGGLALMPRRRR